MQATQAVRPILHSGFATLNTVMTAIFASAVVVTVATTFIGAFSGFVA